MTREALPYERPWYERMRQYGRGADNEKIEEVISVLLSVGTLNVLYLNDMRVVLHALRHSPPDPSVVTREASFLKEGDKRLYTQQRQKDDTNNVIGSTALSQ